MNRNEDYQKSEDWLRFRRHYLQDNKSNDGNYLCGICGHWVSEDEVTLDHILPRSGANTFDRENIQPAHGYCNYIKGSKHWKPKITKDQYEYLKMLSEL